MAKRKSSTDPVTSYAKSVVAGETLANRLVKLACERHLRDLVDGRERGLRFDRDAAQHALDFFGLLYLDEDVPFVLLPYQQFIIGSIFGWKGDDGYRRFRTAYIECAKGAGKSPLASGVGLCGLIADGEPAPEIYAGATKRDQAMILFRAADKIVTSTPELAKILKKSGRFPHVWNLAYEPASGFFRPISSDENSQSGPIPHMGLLDELHEHRSGVVVNMMRAGTKNRKQALLFEISNSGFDRQSICWQHHKYSVEVLEGTMQNDTWFAYVCGLDVCEKHREEGIDQPVDGCDGCDDWKNPAVWPKANPGLPTLPGYKYITERLNEALGMPALINDFKRLNCCIWTQSSVRAIPSDKWQACGHGSEPLAWRTRMLELLRGRQCIGGLDLGSTADLTALVLLFYREEKPWPFLPFFWCPSEGIQKRSEIDRVPYSLWVEQGFMAQTDGAVTDYDALRADLNSLAEDYGIEEWAVDIKFQGVQLCTQMMSDGMEVKAYGQGYNAMACPARRVLEKILAGEYDHGNNPVMTWQASNAATRTNPDGYIKFDKLKSTEKIDGIVSLTMAEGLAMLRDDGGEDEGIVYIDPW